MKKSVSYRVAKKMKNMLLLNHFSLGKVFMDLAEFKRKRQKKLAHI
jgi:hypothetical protein